MSRQNRFCQGESYPSPDLNTLQIRSPSSLRSSRSTALNSNNACVPHNSLPRTRLRYELHGYMISPIPLTPFPEGKGERRCFRSGSKMLRQGLSLSKSGARPPQPPLRGGFIEAKPSLKHNNNTPNTPKYTTTTPQNTIFYGVLVLIETTSFLLLATFKQKHPHNQVSREIFFMIMIIKPNTHRNFSRSPPSAT